LTENKKVFLNIMSLEDPFFVVKDEVLKALNKTRELYERWKNYEDGPEYRTEEEEWTTTELKNSLRSIEWDLEDLEDTVQIVEKNPTKFRIDGTELAIRKGFIESTKEEVRQMKLKITTQGEIKPNGQANSPVSHGTVQHGTTVGNKYSRLSSVADSPHREYIVGMEGPSKQHQQQLHQEQIIRQQDETMDMMSESMGTIRSMSNHIAVELDEQAVMLDEFGAEVDHADSRLDTTIKKMAKVLHLSNDRRQWMAIGTISSAILLVLFLLFVM